MKAIEVNKGDKVLFEDEIVTVQLTGLNHVTIRLSTGEQRIVSYSQIQKYEPE